MPENLGVCRLGEHLQPRTRLCSRLAARAEVPFRVLSGQARPYRTVLIGAHSAHGGQAMAPILVASKVFEICWPRLQAEATPTQVGLVQQVHFSLRFAYLRRG